MKEKKEDLSKKDVQSRFWFSCLLPLGFHLQVGLPKLRKLKLQGVHRVKEIWAGDISPPPDSSLRNLTRLKIVACRELVRAILHRLEYLLIRSCNSLREIVGSEAALGGGVASSGLPKLREIRLAVLPKLEIIFFSVSSLTCQCLSSMEISKCGRLINLFSSPSTAHAFAPDLQDLGICECEKMEEIVSGGSTGKVVVLGDHASSSSPHSLQIIFPRLKHLKLSFLPNLTSHCPSGYLLGSESSLKIEHCGKAVSSLRKHSRHLNHWKKSLDNFAGTRIVMECMVPHANDQTLLPLPKEFSNIGTKKRSQKETL